MIRVWFNHWFSTVYRLIELMKDDREEEIYVIGSNTQKDSVIGKVCDEWYEEPHFDGEEYIEFCLNFCKEHGVQVFVPRRNMVEISRNIDKFHALGVKVMVDDFEKINLLNDKAAAYALFKSCPGVNVPDYFTVNTAAEFKKAYSTLKDKYNNVCVKFVNDEGGKSFRHIVENTDGFEKLRLYRSADIDYGELNEILSTVDSFEDLMVMPYLDGDEISVDCLSTADGIIAITRIKGCARHERIVYDENILKMTYDMMERIKLEYPCNVQFKLMNNIPYFLEINTRMSGGLQMSCLAAEVNIPNIALNKLLGKNIPWTIDRREKTVSYIEIPKIINNK